ncbi:hypothetical protein F383_07696 [Gossypium arboreum]|uniref:Uncharacterized protein n=1 Tax=Gossypium arboreum TaxID=29729 RepID=A0A0B0PHG7_GOSAR|nr:hypothetical protein F383_07696 [Gossypium arboreum]
MSLASYYVNEASRVLFSIPNGLTGSPRVKEMMSIAKLARGSKDVGGSFTLSIGSFECN